VPPNISCRKKFAVNKHADIGEALLAGFVLVLLRFRVCSFGEPASAFMRATNCQADAARWQI
jgi:hypothetical protein